MKKENMKVKIKINYKTGHKETDSLLTTKENRERVKKSLEEYKSGKFIKRSAKELGLI